ncbi:MAG: YfhO family protein [Spirochaetia bacterium]|nr:YfhO family protein [Spirochaetia bacterium]
MTLKDRMYAGVLAVFSVIMFLPMYISPKVMGWLDAMFYFMPFRMLTGEVIRAGDMPFWNPYIYCGNPLMANMQSAIFYPLNIFFHVFDPLTGTRITTFCTFFIMAASVYFLLRLYKHSEEASLRGAVFFAFSTFSTVKAVEFADINTMAWMPAVIYFTKKYADSGRVQDKLLIPFALSMSLLGGHPQFFAYGYFVFLCFYFYETLLRGGVRDNWAGSLKQFLLINIIFAGIVMIQVLPTLEFIMNSRRTMGGIGVRESASTSLQFEHIIAFFAPVLANFFSKETLFLNWIGLVDIGVLGVMLFFCGAIYTADRGRRNLLMGMFAFSLIAAFLGSIPFYPWIFEHVGVLRTIRYPGKAIVIAFFVICFFAASGYDALFEEKKERLAPFAKWVIITAIAGLLLYAAADFLRDPIIKLYKDIFDPLISFQKLLDMIENYSRLLPSFFLFECLLLVSAAIVYAVAVKGIKGPVMRYSAAATALLCMMTFSSAWSGIYAKIDWMKIETTQIRRLLADNSLSSNRILAPIAGNRFIYECVYESIYDLYYYNMDSMTPNMVMNHKLRNADGFDSLFLGDFAALKTLLNDIDNPWDAPAFGLLGVKYISSKPAISGKSLKFVSKGWNDLYLNTNNMGPAFIAGRGSKVHTASRKDAAEYYVKNGLLPSRDILVEPQDKIYADDAVAASTGSGGDSKVSVAWKGLNTCEVDVEGPGGLMVVTDNYYPGWKAWVDGKKTKVIRADITFKAVTVGPGAHKVRFKYDPPEFMPAAVISIMLLLVLLPVVPALIRLF